jgi:predicted AAA+ superfamily ATPase
MQRYLLESVKKDLERKMVFVGGPRQVGKTTFSKTFITSKAGYMNYDLLDDRRMMIQGPWPKTSVWVFDEIHKYARWRNLIKGLYDTHHETKKILVTGSARLDYYRRGGDSLQGRYHYYRMHPLTVAELKIKTQKDLMDLFHLGGFPEPFLGGSIQQANRWRKDYATRIIAEDITTLEQSQRLTEMEILLWRLPELVSSPLSIESIRQDIGTTHATISKWLDIFERLYAIYRISPFGPPKIRAVKKEQKHYHFDWGQIEDLGARFENMVAGHLLKWIHYYQDTEAQDLDLRFFKTSAPHEVDFIVLENGQPKWAIECKSRDQDISKSLKYFKRKYPGVRALQISLKGTKDYVTEDEIEVRPALTFLRELI